MLDGYQLKNRGTKTEMSMNKNTENKKQLTSVKSEGKIPSANRMLDEDNFEERKKKRRAESGHPSDKRGLDLR